MKYILEEKYILDEKHILDEKKVVAKASDELTADQVDASDKNKELWKQDYAGAIKNAEGNDEEIDEILDSYYEEFAEKWGVKKDKIEGLNPAFEQELLELGFDAKSNPFLAFLTKPRQDGTLINDFNLNADTYGVLHNAYAHDYNNGDLEGNGIAEESNIIFKKELYNKSIELEEEYLRLSTTLLTDYRYIKSKPKNQQKIVYMNIMYATNTNRQLTTNLDSIDNIKRKIATTFTDATQKHEYKPGEFKDLAKDGRLFASFIIYLRGMAAIGRNKVLNFDKKVMNASGNQYDPSDDTNILYVYNSAKALEELSDKIGSLKITPDNAAAIAEDIIKRHDPHLGSKNSSRPSSSTNTNTTTTSATGNAKP